MCAEATYAGTVDKSVEELNALGMEHPDNYSIGKIKRIQGEVK